jgi:hypothetical protein
VTKRGRQEPTQAVILPYEATKGDQAVRLYNLTGRTCQEWQANLLRAIMATNPDGLWMHVKFGNHGIHRYKAKPPNPARLSGFSMSPESVGFEPTCPCGQLDFESSSLRPLR